MLSLVSHFHYKNFYTVKNTETVVYQNVYYDMTDWEVFQ